MNKTSLLAIAALTLIVIAATASSPFEKEKADIRNSKVSQLHLNATALLNDAKINCKQIPDYSLILTSDCITNLDHLSALISAIELIPNKNSPNLSTIIKEVDLLSGKVYERIIQEASLITIDTPIAAAASS